MLRRIVLGTLVLGTIVWSATREPLAVRVGAQGGSSPKTKTSSLWKNIAPGVEMRTLRTPLTQFDVPVEITALRVRPSRIKVASGLWVDAASWRKRYGAVAAVNGGYFDDRKKPLGLRISANRKTRELHPADWGVFYIVGNTAKIVHTRDYRALRERGRTRRVLEAIQCGPRLVVNGAFTNLKNQWARRTAIGVDREGYVVVAVADGQLSFGEWQRTWRDKLGCPNALNLDGGGSTQLSLRAGHLRREIQGYTPVPDAIVIR